MAVDEKRGHRLFCAPAVADQTAGLRTSHVFGLLAVPTYPRIGPVSSKL